MTDFEARYRRANRDAKQDRQRQRRPHPRTDRERVERSLLAAQGEAVTFVRDFTGGVQ